MFLGHFAMGLLASRREPALPLGTAFLAAQLPDAIWPYLLLGGIERVSVVPGDTVVTPLRFDHYPWSHSLLLVSLVGMGSGLGYAALRRSRAAALWIPPLTVSHWLLDAVSHRPDMPLWPGGPVVGLGLWNSLPWTLAVELTLFALGVALYARGRRVGHAFWALTATLGGIYLASVFGPPPPDVTAIALSMIATVPLIWLWGNRVGVRS